MGAVYTSRQSRTDSIMEVVTNTAIGLVISTIANHFVLPAVLGVQMTLGENLIISVVFTAISIIRSYVIRRAFNGRSVWQAIKVPVTGFLRRNTVRAISIGLLIVHPLIALWLSWRYLIEDTFFFEDMMDHLRMVWKRLKDGGQTL